jgi:hypothetical protein
MLKHGSLKDFNPSWMWTVDQQWWWHTCLQT